MNKYWKSGVDAKTREAKGAQAQIIQMEKMASIGLLAAQAFIDQLARSKTKASPVGY